MTLEENVFKRCNIDFCRLAQYGFCLIENKWQYSVLFLNGEFSAVIIIDLKGHVFGNVYETATNDVFLPLRVEGMDGFATKVRTAYLNILKDIKEKCCHENIFVFSQANRLAREIDKQYKDKPVFPWDDFSGGVFKNPNNGKWYAIVMNINSKKIDPTLSGEIEIVNIKLEPEKIKKLHQEKGFYPAYHMNKKNWITIMLNDVVSDKVLFELLQESHNFTIKKHPRA